ncbi:hypothetical protein ACFL4V_01225 [Candidatus Latescibacterota bacterium]
MPITKIELPWWTGIVFGVIIVGIATTISVLLSKFDATNIFTAIVLVTLSAISGAIVARFTASKQITDAEEDIKRKFNALEGQITKFQDEINKIIAQSEICRNCANSLGLSVKTVKQLIEGKFGESLITYEDLIQIEGIVENNREIWVLTSALQLESVELREVIYKNFKKGIKYKYLIPQEDKRLQKRMIDLAKEWQSSCNLSARDAQEQIQCYLVPKHFAYMTVIVYDPYKDTPTVLVKFPTSEFYEKEKYPLVYRVDTKPKEAWEVFVHSLQEMMDDPQKCVLTKQLSIDFSNK